jgi:hypothetical protein
VMVGLKTTPALPVTEGEAVVGRITPASVFARLLDPRG